MRTSSIYATGHTREENRLKVGKSTAYYLFEHRDTNNLYPFMMDAVHMKAVNGMLDVPIVSDGSPEDIDRIAREMHRTNGTPYAIMTYYMDGAKIQFHKPEVAVKIYQLIVKHFRAHLDAMKTDPLYDPPPIESFQRWAEFAIAIRPTALRKDKRLETGPAMGGLEYLMRRPSFSAFAPIVTPVDAVAKSDSLYNSIESFLERL